MPSVLIPTRKRRASLSKELQSQTNKLTIIHQTPRITLLKEYFREQNPNHDNLMVIKMNITSYMVKWVLMDQGSLEDVRGCHMLRDIPKVWMLKVVCKYINEFCRLSYFNQGSNSLESNYY